MLDLPFSSEKLLTVARDIRRKLVSPDEDAYLVEAMLPIYDQIRQLKGTSYLKEQSELLRCTNHVQVGEIRKDRDQRSAGPRIARSHSKPRSPSSTGSGQARTPKWCLKLSICLEADKNTSSRGLLKCSESSTAASMPCARSIQRPIPRLANSITY